MKLKILKNAIINRDYYKPFAGILILFLSVTSFAWSKEEILLWNLPYIFRDNQEMPPEKNIEQNIWIEPETEEEIMITKETIHLFTALDDLRQYVYAVDAAAYVTEKDLDVPALLSVDLTTDMSGSDPKVLIFHTHSQETFIDSRPGVEEDSIVGVGQTLAEILASEYNITVVHDKGVYDMEDGRLERGNSYERMEPYILKVLETYPSIEIVIDLHRDGVREDLHLITEIDGEPVAKVMFFNGICRLNDQGSPKEVGWLENPYIQTNLAFSLQMHLKSNELYPGFMRKIYIKPYRYSLHMKPKSLLVEAGANTNTVAEVKNAMPYLAEVLAEILNGDF